MSNHDEFVVAIMDTAIPGKILQGMVLGTYRTLEYAERELPRHRRRAVPGVGEWRVGIFQNGKLVTQ